MQIYTGVTNLTYEQAAGSWNETTVEILVCGSTQGRCVVMATRNDRAIEMSQHSLVGGTWCLELKMSNLTPAKESLQWPIRM